MGLISTKTIMFTTFALLALFVLNAIIMKTCSSWMKARIFRGQFVALIETVLTGFSYFIWRSLSRLPALLSISDDGARVNRSVKRYNYSGSPTDQKSVLFSYNDIQSSSTNQCDILWKIILVLYLSLCQMSYFTNIYFMGTEPHWFAMLCYTCLGSYIQLLVGLCFFKGVSSLIPFLRKYFSLVDTRKSDYISRRETYVAIFSLTYMICASLMGIHTVSQPPPVKHVTIPVKDLPSRFEHFKILQLSDIHLGPTVGFSRLKTIVNIVNNESPDAIVITGDLVDGSVKTLKDAAQPLKFLEAKYGKFFVSGNHEYYTGDVDNWFSFLTSLGISVLHNSHMTIPEDATRNEPHICIGGTDDIQADKFGYGDHGFHVAKAVGSCNPENPVILLAHQPHAAQMALDSSYRIDVVLSGHTHGGQMFPLMVFAYFSNPFFTGLYKYGHTEKHVYVSQGTQYWGIPMRIGTTMEITHITLVASGQ